MSLACTWDAASAPPPDDTHPHAHTHAQLQSTRASLEEVGGGRAATTRLLPDVGPEGEPFSFAALKAQRGQDVAVAAVSAQEGDNVDAVEAFIRRCVPV